MAVQPCMKQIPIKKNDVIEIKPLGNTDTTTWSDEFVKFTLTIT